MKAEDVKIGMKVKIVKNPPIGSYGHNQVGGILTALCWRYGSLIKAEGFTGVAGGSIGGIDCMYLEPALEPFTKADLKTGMRLVYREGAVRVITGIDLRNGEGALSFSLNAFGTDLLFPNSYNNRYDIMEVYAAPEKCEDFFNLDVRGELLFKREEKTEKQKQAEKLMKQADDLKAQFEALVKQATDLAGAGE